MKKHCFEINGEGYKISVISYEPACGDVEKVIIALHGFGGDKESSAVYRLAERATQRGCAVIAFDFPCHGQSPVGEERFTVENCIKDGCSAYAFVKNKYFSDGNVEGNIHFFATSFGGYILSQMLEKPCFKGNKAVFRSPAVKMHKTFSEIIANSAFAELANGGKVECGFERKLILDYDFYLDLKNHSLEHVFFDNEALMIYGDRDDVVCPGDMAEFAAARPNIAVKVIEGADHRYKVPGHLDKAVNAAVSFLLD